MMSALRECLAVGPTARSKRLTDPTRACAVSGRFDETPVRSAIHLAIPRTDPTCCDPSLLWYINGDVHAGDRSRKGEFVLSVRLGRPAPH